MHAVRPRGPIPSPLTVSLTVKYTFFYAFPMTCILNLLHCTVLPSCPKTPKSHRRRRSPACGAQLQYFQVVDLQVVHISCSLVFYIWSDCCKKQGKIVAATPGRVKGEASDVVFQSEFSEADASLGILLKVKTPSNVHEILSSKQGESLCFSSAHSLRINFSDKAKTS